MEVRLRATANFDYEQVAACNISISVVDSQEISQGNGLKLSSYSNFSEKLIFSHETGFQELGFRTLTRLGNQFITVNIINVNDFPPYFLQKAQRIQVQENLSGLIVGQLFGADGDDGVYGEIEFSVKENPHLNVTNTEAATAIIYLVRNLLK